MSYLDLPRLHFGGAFFSDPGTRNNVPQNFAPGVGEPGGPPVVGSWNTNGLAHFYFRDCHVSSFVNSEGRTLVSQTLPSAVPDTEVSADPLLGGWVQTPNPFSDLVAHCPGMKPSMAKICDLDTDQQGRSALYGLQIAVTFRREKERVGFWGKMTVPFLQDLGRRIEPPIPKFFSRNLGGVWHGFLREVHWIGDIDASPALVALREACRAGISGPDGAIASGGLAVKLTTDLYQPQARYQQVVGDDFCFGRVLGTIGPHYLGEAEHVLPGRRLRAAKGQSRASAPFIVHRVGEGHQLSLDLGNSLYLRCVPSRLDPRGRQLYSAEGALETPAGYRLVVADPKQGIYEPVCEKSISFIGRELRRKNLWKNHVCQIDSCVVQIPLSEREADLLSNRPLGLMLDGQPLLVEANDGLQFDVLTPVVRLEQGVVQRDGGELVPPAGSTEENSTSSTGTFDSQPWYELLGPEKVRIRVLRFGRPVVHTEVPIPLWAVARRWYRDWEGQWRSFDGPSDLELRTDRRTDGSGILTVDLGVVPWPMRLSVLRQSLGSRTNFIRSSWPLGDVGGEPVSVLVWEGAHGAESPEWDDIRHILEGYAQTYPGMQRLLDIADPTLLREPRINDVMVNRFSVHPDEPDFMPVTRDLAPSRIGMLVNWLRDNRQHGGAAPPSTAAESADESAGASVKATVVRTRPTEEALPFRIELEPLETPGWPGLHSFTAGVSGDRAIVFGGWTRGMHGFSAKGGRSLSPVFDSGAANGNAYAIDLSTGKLLGEKPLAPLGSRLARHLSSSNTQYMVEEGWLYVFGGFGMSVDGSLTTQAMVTAIELDAMIDTVASPDEQLDAAFAESHIAYQQTLVGKITGGELGRLGEHWVIGFGQDFDGSHGLDLMRSDYHSCVSVFDVQLDQGPGGPELSVHLLDRRPEDPTKISSNSPYHRRDLNFVPAILPDGSRHWVAFGGVFKGGRFGFFESPIFCRATPEGRHPISTWPAESIRQLTNQYRCANLPLFSAGRATSYTLFFGGMSQYQWLADSSSLLQTQGPVAQPFVSEASAMVLSRAGAGEAESLRCRQFRLEAPTLPPVGAEPIHALDPGITSPRHLPSAVEVEENAAEQEEAARDSDTDPEARKEIVGHFLGTETVFLPSKKCPLHDNGVIDLDAIDEPTVVGHFLGGIASSDSVILDSYTWASDRIYRVKVIPNEPTAGFEVENPEP